MCAGRPGGGGGRSPPGADSPATEHGGGAGLVGLDGTEMRPGERTRLERWSEAVPRALHGASPPEQCSLTDRKVR